MTNKISKSEPTLKDNHFRHIGKWVFLIIGISLSVCILAYAGLALASTQYSLPGLMFNGRNVGLKSVSGISKIVESEKNNLKAQRLTFQFENQTTQKSLQELGVSIDVPQSTRRVFDFGKTEKIFPTIAYIIDLTKNNARVKPYIVKSADFENQVRQIFQQKQDAQNATLTLINGQLNITQEKLGYKIDTNDLKKSIEDRLASRNFSKVITANKISVKSNVNSSDIAAYQGDIQTVVSTKLTLQAPNKKIYPKDSDLLGFIDLERTILNQTVTYSDSAIDNYLRSIEKQIDVAGVKKKISSLDNSILDAGKEGKKLDVTKSRENIKTALSSKSIAATLVVTTAPIQEEVISPGFNPGKYPGKFIEVNLSQQMLYTFDGANLVNSFKVSTGKWSMPTPQGEYSINNKNERAFSQTYGLYMPYWMAFIGSEYGIHELPEWPDGTKEGESHLGTPVSHGCIRLGRGSAQEVYNWTEVGTPVYIHK